MIIITRKKERIVYLFLFGYVKWRINMELNEITNKLNEARIKVEDFRGSL
ncbi:hypothetical protein SAMN04488102_104242 [Alkalibacterium subtropicum]|uniref:Uncharacterized protein n=1 Tax=Alkalibacterium subtropicum TaxID=753702 RepID=A0A1I1HXU0_9LACT|nr:hypothetical protein SAMN04488102_104242 [Alkalibacterium subtropicum]